METSRKEGIRQTINKSFESKFEFAKIYYSIIFQLNKIKTTNNELNLICYSAVNGTFSTPPIREQFMKDFGIPKGSLYNMLSKLQQKKILVKVQNKIRINPQIQLDFDRPFYKLDIILRNNGSYQENKEG